MGGNIHLVEYNPKTDQLCSIYNSGRDEESFVRKTEISVKALEKLESFEWGPEPDDDQLPRRFHENWTDPETGVDYQGEWSSEGLKHG